MEIESELGTLKLLLGLTLSLTILVMLISIVILLKLQLKRSGKTKKKPVMELPAVIYRNQQVWTLTLYYFPRQLWLQA